MNKYFVIGDGGHANETAAWAADSGMLVAATLGRESAGSVFETEDPSTAFLIMGLGWPGPKFKAYKNTPGDWRWANVIHPSAVHASSDREKVQGLVQAPLSLVSVNVSLGKFVTINYGATVGHDCKVGQFASIMPGARISGSVDIGDFAFIGAGAVILEGRKIGAGAVVGAGAIVTRDVQENETVVGNPARVH